MRWCWVNIQCRSVLPIWIRVGQRPTALAVGAVGDCLDIFSLVYHFFSWKRPDMVGWLFLTERTFETVFKSISGRLSEIGRKKREMIDKRKNV